MTRHKMNERLDTLIEEIGDDKPSEDQRSRMERLDTQMTEIQKHAERVCRKILRPDLSFSPSVKFWFERVQAYRAMLKLKEGKIKHKGHCV